MVVVVMYLSANGLFVCLLLVVKSRMEEGWERVVQETEDDGQNSKITNHVICEAHVKRTQVTDELEYVSAHSTTAISTSQVSLHLLRVIEDVREVAPSAVLTIVHRSHKDTCTARLGRTLPPQTLDLAISVHFVVLEHSELSLLALVLDLLGSGVDLLLALLGTAAQTQDEVERGLLLDVVVGERAAIFELLAGEDQALLVWWNALLVCDETLVVADA